jgi:Cdc6-like AAA superfamily ATPase
MSMRDAQILFQPYGQEDIESIVQEKKNSKFQRCVPSMDMCQGNENKTKQRQIVREIFFNLIDEKAMLFLCKKIS